MSNALVATEESPAAIAAAPPPPAGSARRSLIFLALGASLGLALAGYSLFSGRGSDPRLVPADAIAVVSGRQILRRDFEAQAESEHGKPFKEISAAARQGVLETMIREELLVQRGLEIDVTKTDPDVRQAIVNAVNLSSATELDAALPSDAELRNYYDNHRENYVIFGTFQLRELVLPAGPNAEAGAARAVEALRKLSVDAELASVMAQFDLRDSGRFASGEIVEPVVERTLGPELYALLLKLAPGEVSAPVRQPDGFHFLLVRQHQPKRYFPFEEERDTVLRNMRSEAQAKAEQELVDSLRAKAEILIAPPYGH